MSNLPPLGGFHPKMAAAYLLPPSTGTKKKPKKRPALEDKEKMASFLETIVTQEAQNMLSHLAGFDIQSGWKK